MIVVIGLAATGLATARVLSKRGERVCVLDAKPEAQLLAERVAEARAIPNVTLCLGQTQLPSGTELVIPSPGVPRDAPPILEALAQNIEIASEIEIAYRLAKAPILAITGTNGKTTTTAMLGAICRAANLETYVAGNIAEDGGKRLPLIEAADIASENAVIVAEISSFQLEWVRDFKPKVAAWLNLTNDHLDRYADLSEYAATKARLFAAQTRSDFAIINADDPVVVRQSRGIGDALRLPFHGAAPQLDPSLRLRPDDLNVPGQHNLANACAAAAMALAFGIGSEAIREGLVGFLGVAHRMEFVAEIDKIRFVNNSMCTNPAAVAASLDALSGTPVIAISGGRHKGGDIAEMVEALAKHTKCVILIGEDAELLQTELSKLGFIATECATDLPDAVLRAANQAISGDTVLLIPGFASFDMFSGFEQRGQVFRDAVLKLKWGRE